MKTLTFTAAMILSTGLSAGQFNSPFEVGNPDLYHGVDASSQLSTAVQPGIGDSYAYPWLGNGGFSDTETVVQRGTNEGYGSHLLDLGHEIDW
ncbi:hypothetical protein [endosymbiont of Ridgeia piscesae]|jgi:hypothetical protein|uniref:Uncharacterized protein n=1 Tax=endosymbiont of Ridgeia piscesae TaxID=54398 RepID=A0A0T5Z618_9GAMM|nr:hypothetical protein [endosymbiont of Ridgeia piscesae]KRT56240.1 hypothetical protein Ga0074115_1362 [endosymbiont of Ridgeia piscesae]KRT58332.1 hypothetical protein Ga0076813_13313 [endosymbiont of Ridgeia piscesae]